MFQTVKSKLYCQPHRFCTRDVYWNNVGMMNKKMNWTSMEFQLWNFTESVLKSEMDFYSLLHRQQTSEPRPMINSSSVVFQLEFSWLSVEFWHWLLIILHLQWVFYFYCTKRHEHKSLQDRNCCIMLLTRHLLFASISLGSMLTQS